MALKNKLMDDNLKYPGEELILFKNAINWKNYFSRLIKDHIHGKVLECGAGIGSTCKILNNGNCKEWILLEPDKEMAEILKNKFLIKELPGNCIIKEGIISLFENTPQFDTILYIDVLEHIEYDQVELEMATSRLNQGGKLIIVSPAFPILYSPFDKTIGHFKRYTKKDMDSMMPENMNKVFLRYIDSMGFFLSFANRILLKQKYPTMNQIGFWDKFIVPVSKFTDKVFLYSFGKSILGIWEKK